MTAQETHPGVLVGYDGTPCAREAVRFAAAEAVLRRAPLHVVHARLYAPGVPDPVLAEAAGVVHETGSSAQASFEVTLGHAADVLAERSAEAALLVVGRGSLGALGLPLGSVAAELVARSRCPVAVVADGGRAFRPGRGDVVVGVDPAGGNEAALELAFEEAFARRTGLVAVQACSYEVPAGQGTDPWTKVTARPPVATGGHRLHESVHAVHARYPAVPVTELLRQGRPARVLLEAVENACVAVVGSRGHGPVAGRLLGSVGQYLLRHAHCPVLVAPAPAATPAILALGGP